MIVKVTRIAYVGFIMIIDHVDQDIDPEILVSVELSILMRCITYIHKKWSNFPHRFLKPLSRLSVKGFRWMDNLVDLGQNNLFDRTVLESLSLKGLKNRYRILDHR